MSVYSSGLQAFLNAVSLIELVVCVLASVVLGRRWWRNRSAATASVLGVFVVFALVVLASFYAPDDPKHGWQAVYVDVLVSVLLLMPYLLAQFSWLLGGSGRRAHQAVVALLVLGLVLTFVVPPLPQPGEPRPGWAQAYVAFIVIAWVAQTAVAARGLWRLSGGQSAVVRHRMRLLSAGATALALTVVLSGLTGGRSPGAFTVVVSLAGLMSVLLYAVAFLVPPFLRLVWRQEDLAVLAEAERGLMTVVTRDEVADTIVPVLARVLGGSGAALLDGDGRYLLGVGSTPDAGLCAEVGPGQVSHVRSGVLVAGLSSGHLVVTQGALAPVVGSDEAALLGRVATLVDLALQRVDLFTQERASRQAAETMSGELETLLYSVSHDLRSPLISVLGYLDCLRTEYGDLLTGEAPHYVDRISVNALYMQSLIADLLELSRIGRLESVSEPLDLHELAEEVLESARVQQPSAQLAVVGRLPVVLLSAVRARQLLTNLVDNAVKYSGVDDVRVTVSTAVGPEGGLVLRVADDGRGIPEEYRTRVLKVFERLDAPKSSSGTGIGLAICKRIAESHGGGIVISGPPQGARSGTTVEVSMPSVLVTTRSSIPSQGKALVKEGTA